jgi:hypothetical protein
VRVDRSNGKKNRKIVRINGVKIVNAENSKKQQERPQKDATAGTRNLIWITDKDNLQL